MDVNMNVTFDHGSLAFSTISSNHHIYATADGFYSRTNSMKLRLTKKDALAMYKNLELIVDMRGQGICRDSYPFACIDYARAIELDTKFTSNVR
jgi:hypothetical protein